MLCVNIKQKSDPDGDGVIAGLLERRQMSSHSPLWGCHLLSCSSSPRPLLSSPLLSSPRPLLPFPLLSSPPPVLSSPLLSSPLLSSPLLSSPLLSCPPSCLLSSSHIH